MKGDEKRKFTYHGPYVNYMILTNEETIEEINQFIVEERKKLNLQPIVIGGKTRKVRSQKRTNDNRNTRLPTIKGKREKLCSLK